MLEDEGKHGTEIASKELSVPAGERFYHDPEWDYDHAGFEQERPDYLFLLMKRWRFISGVTIFAAVIGIIFANVLPKKYQSASLIKLGSYSSPADGAVGKFLERETAKKDYLQSQVAMLETYTLAEKTLLRNRQIREYFMPPEEDAVEEEVKSSSNQIPDGILGAYLGSMQYEMVHGTSLVRITAYARDPYIAAAIANSHAQSFITQIQSNLGRLATINVDFLRERTAEAEATASAARRESIEYARLNGLAGADEAQVRQSLSQRYQTLFGRLNDSILTRARSEAKFRGMRGSSSGNSIQFDPVVSSEFVRLSEIDAELQLAKTQGFTNTSYTDQLKQEKRSLEGALKSFGARQARTTEVEYKAALEAEKILKNELSKLSDDERELYSSMVDFNVLKDKADAAESLYKQVQRRYEDALINAKNDQNIVLLIDKARVPTKPISPKKFLVIVMSIALGLGSAVFFCVLTDTVDRSIRSVEDLLSVYRLPVLAIIPAFGSLESYKDNYYPTSFTEDDDRERGVARSKKLVTGLFGRSGKRKIVKAELEVKAQVTDSIGLSESPEVGALTEQPYIEEVTGVVQVEESSSMADSPTSIFKTSWVPTDVPSAVADTASTNRDDTRSFSRSADLISINHHTDEADHDDELVVLSRPFSRESEAFREILATLDVSALRDRAMSILLTSSEKGDGKSTVSANLAAALGSVSASTILIDIDFRLPSLGRTFEFAPDAVGVSDFLMGDATVSEIIYLTEVPGLAVIPAGTYAETTQALVALRRLKDLIDVLSDNYDFIILDGPPLLHVSDALTVSKMVDGVAVVVRSGKTEKATYKWVVDRLHQVGASIIGTILNDVPKSEFFGRYN